MYQILIADDEAAERDVIRFLLKKYDFPLQITEAANGRDALDLLQKKSFDILYTDIKMPFIDGLKLAGEARGLYPEMPIIFFSGYDDFDYVKEALSLHVVNYILKPVDPDEFEKTIRSVLDTLRLREQKSRREQKDLEAARNHALYQLINNTGISYLKSIDPRMDFTFAYEYHRLFLIQMEQDFFGFNASDEDTGFFPVNLADILPENSDFINLNPSQNLLLFSGPRHRMEWYHDQAKMLAGHIKKRCKMNCYIAISSPFDTPEAIARAYAEAERHLEERFFFANRQLYGEDASDKKQPPDESNDDALLKQIAADIQFKDSFSLRQNVTLLLDHHKNRTQYSLIYIRFLCTSLLRLLLDGLGQNSGNVFDTLAECIYSFRQFSEIEAIIRNLLDELASHLDSEQQSPKHAIQLVKQYVYQHYGEDLGLELLAEKVYLTPRYLSTMFSRETGCGINKFIKNVRMEKTRELLLNTNMKISDICQAVGYSNVSYFCKSFLEEYGLTPEKFRHQKENTGERR